MNTNYNLTPSSSSPSPEAGGSNCKPEVLRAPEGNDAKAKSEPQNTDKIRKSRRPKSRPADGNKIGENNGRAKPTKAAKPVGQTPIELPQGDGRTDREAVAFAMIKPSLRHGQLVGELGQLMVAQLPDEQRPGIAEYRKEASKQIAAAEGGDLTIVSQLLAAQALSLDAIFTELARRSAINLSGHLDASERYMKMALRAQTGCRTTLQALADLHRPREQTVKHVTVNEGGQAVVADQFHNHKTGGSSERPADQPHEQCARGTALPGPDAARDDVPMPGDPGKATMQAPRRPVDGGANG